MDHGVCRRVGNQSLCTCRPGFADEDCSGLLCPGPDCGGNGRYQLYLFIQVIFAVFFIRIYFLDLIFPEVLNLVL